MTGLTHATRIVGGNYDLESLDPLSASPERFSVVPTLRTPVPAIVGFRLVDTSSSASTYRVFAEALEGFREVEFEELADEWKSTTQFLSDYTDMVSHPAYLKIIGMGRQAVPLLLRKLERDPDHWFEALRATAKVDPVPAEDRGAFDRMREAWLEWGRREDLLADGD